MHPSNYTLYQLVKYHIELTEAMEYSLITYKFDENELVERFKFLKDDYKKGFYHEITSKLFRNSKKLTKDVKTFIKNYNRKKINKMVIDHNLHTRLEYNRKLYLAYHSSNSIIQVFLNEKEINSVLEKSLIKLVETTNNHFILFCLFDSLNLYVSTKTIIMQGDSLYTLDSSDIKILEGQLISIKDEITDKSLLNDALELIQEKKQFNEDDAYELLNKISIECIKAEKQLYSDFESFSNKLEKEIKKNHN